MGLNYAYVTSVCDCRSLVKHSMDTSNLRPNQGGSVGVDTSNLRPNQGGSVGGDSSMESDWRVHLSAVFRHRIVMKIIETIKKHQSSGPEKLHEIKTIAVRVEEKIYTTATNQGDYMRKISVKLLGVQGMENRSAGSSVKHSDLGQWKNSRLQDCRSLVKHSMDTSNSRPNQGGSGGGDSSMESDWRGQLSTDSRHRVVMKIIETLKKHQSSGPEKLHEIKTIAVRVEEKIYTTAINLGDYMRKISLKLLGVKGMENRSAGSSVNHSDLDIVVKKCSYIAVMGGSLMG
ncbi:hypothetical protein L2E82_06768 [Cichorium intybus]|uniref:Uncharacterized protein n=1 Tax=Cichorium intybus TaxID=13427 RepID=A0ACB9HAY4_CICIN|nr:hypothetical protein L2E82_06768 [Cichorium intybus]